MEKWRLKKIPGEQERWVEKSEGGGGGGRFFEIIVICEREPRGHLAALALAPEYTRRDSTCANK